MGGRLPNLGSVDTEFSVFSLRVSPGQVLGYTEWRGGKNFPLRLQEKKSKYKVS